MRTFGKIFKVNMLEELQYKGSYISGIICQFAFGFMYIFLYLAFFESGVPQNFDAIQMASYVWLGQAFFAMFSYSDLNKNDITHPIINGNVSYQLIKPVNLYDLWFSQVLSKGISKTIVRSIPLLIITMLIPSGYGLSLPATLLNFALFVVALVLGCLLMTAIKMFAYLFTLYTLDAKGVFAMIYAIFGFLGGAIIPIPLLPQTIQNILNFMPFRYVSDLAFRAYIGNLDITTILWQIGVQIAWILGLVVLGRVLLTKKSKKLVVQGG